ncbi:hypothetical protein ABK040_007771 [Willaertia magna]
MDKVFTYDSFVHATAGSIGGQCAMATFYPFEIIRTHIQASDHLKGKSTLEVIKILMEEDGIGSLYQGIKPVLISLLASNFIYFYTNNMFKVWYKQYSGKRSIPVLPNLLISFAAGVVNVLTTCPLWVVTTRMKAKRKGTDSNKNEDGLIQSIIKVSKEEGVSALWSGTLASIVLVTNPMINFTVFDQVKKHYLRWNQKKSLTSSQSFIIGLIAKFVATILTYPLQVAQTKLRTSKKTMSEEEMKKTGIKKYENTLDCLIKMFKEDGVYGWYKGLDTKLVQTLLMSAFHLSVYDKIVSEVERVMGNKPKTH